MLASHVGARDPNAPSLDVTALKRAEEEASHQQQVQINTGALPGLRPVSDTAPRGSCLRVLLVDDNEDTTFVLCMLLETRGLSVITALDGQSALALAERECPDVVVLDLGLPDVDGFSVLAELKQLPGLQASRFIALSGRSLPEEQERIRAAGFHDQFLKPADVDQLVASIRQEP
jgi:CheY-like chemotaxis protein